MGLDQIFLSDQLFRNDVVAILVVSGCHAHRILSCGSARYCSGGKNTSTSSFARVFHSHPIKKTSKCEALCTSIAATKTRGNHKSKTKLHGDTVDRPGTGTQIQSNKKTLNDELNSVQLDSARRSRASQLQTGRGLTTRDQGSWDRHM